MSTLSEIFTALEASLVESVAILMVVSSMIGFYRARSLDRNSERELVELRSKLEAARTIPEGPRQKSDEIGDLLSIAALESRVEERTAKIRRDSLYRTGKWLIQLSVVMPFLAAILYAFLDPLSPSVLEGVTAIAGLEGDRISATVSVQRDWRILVGGVSLGFLFLAAARGLMTQHGRQDERFAELSARTSRLNIISAGFEMPGALLPNEQTKLREVAFEAIFDRHSQDSDDPTEEDVKLPPEVIELLKGLGK